MADLFAEEGKTTGPSPFLPTPAHTLTDNVDPNTGVRTFRKLRPGEHFSESEIKEIKAEYVRISPQFDCIVLYASRAMGVSDELIRNWKKTDADFLQACNDAEEKVFDEMESLIFKRSRESKSGMLYFYARTKMARRGYAEKKEITGANGGPIKTEVEHKMSAIELELLKDVSPIFKNVKVIEGKAEEVEGVGEVSEVGAVDVARARTPDESGKA